MTNLTDKLLSRKEVCKFVGVSQQTIWRWVKDGRFPKPLKTVRRVVWKEADLQAWIDNLEPVA